LCVEHLDLSDPLTVYQLSAIARSAFITRRTAAWTRCLNQRIKASGVSPGGTVLCQEIASG
jgi:hypothetical protein